MAKRTSRTRRRDPVRHPIPAARLRADRSRSDRSRAAAVDEAQLVDGWVLESGVRVRLARTQDLQAVRELVPLTGVPFEDDIAAAIESGIAGAALLAGVRGGSEAFQRHMAEQFFASQDADQRVPFLHATVVLVAEHDHDGIVGAAVAYPPVAVIRQMVQQAGRLGIDPIKIVLGGALAIVRIKALAVKPSMRRHGIGGALLQLCRQLYAHCGYLTVYGQMPPTEGLDDFYRRHGFEVLAPGVGFDPWVVFGFHADIHPEPHERIFIIDQPPRPPQLPAARRPS